MKRFTAEMLNALIAANNSVKGTKEYYKFQMETDCKSEKGTWFFVGFYIPHTTGIIKTFKGNTYIITCDQRFFGNSDHRYHVTDEVKTLLGI